MFINLSNHPHETWCEEQLAAAAVYGEVCDMEFPNVPADADEAWIAGTAEQVCGEILSDRPDAVLVQGEMSLTYSIVKMLRDNGVTVVCASSERCCETEIAPDGSTIRRSVFRFVGFRKYACCGRICCETFYYGYSSSAAGILARASL